MKTVTLGDIFIGKADGGQEAKKKNFLELFYEGNNSYSELENDEAKFIVSGRKGTGKTILAKYYEKKVEEKGGIITTINGNDILLSHIKELGNSQVEDDQIGAFLRYIILFELTKMILAKEEIAIKQTKLLNKFSCRVAMNKIKEMFDNKILKGNFSLNDFSTKEEARGEVSTNELPYNAKIAGKKIKTSHYTKNLYYALIDKLEQFIKQIAKEVRISLIIDDVDECKDGIYNDDKFQLFLRKIILTVKDINTLLYEANPNKKGKVILLLRSDLIDQMQSKSSNLNKTISDSQVLLNWMSKIDEDNPESNILIDLILTKIQRSNSVFMKMEKRDIFNKLFPEKVGNTRIIKYLFNEGHGRPRDIINLLNIAKKNYHSSEQFTSIMFNQAQKEYSKCFKDEIKNEMAIFYSHDKIEECFRIITLMGKITFRISDVEDILDKYKKHITHIDSPVEFIDIMYKEGVIGNRWKKGNYQKYSFKYREDGDENPDYLAEFIVHTGLRKNLLKV